MSNLKHLSLFAVLSLAFVTNAQARPYYYPAVRYMNLGSAALGGVTVSISDEIGNSLFNNPAALARNTKFKAEYLNLNVDANSNLLGNLGLNTLNATSLGGLSTQLNADQNKVYQAGYGGLTALSWGGFAVGALFQRQVSAFSDGTNIEYNGNSQVVPAAGYGIALARGVVRLGYSMQYINQAYGSAITPSTNSAASALSGLSEGRGLSHNASVNFVFPFTYLPTFTILARNIGGTHFVGGSLFTGASNSAGITPDEPMSVDFAFNFVVKVSSKMRSNWHIQYVDALSAYSMSFLDRISVGGDLSLSQNFLLRVGLNELRMSAGIAFKSKSSEIGLTWYNEKNPLLSANDARFGLQYKFYFQDQNTRDPEGEKK